MKYFKILTILLFSSFISFYSCNETTKTPAQETKKSNEVTSPTPTTIKTTQNDGKVYHYICGKGCEGGSGVAGNCSSCGSTLNHNAAFHANTNNTQNASPLVNPPATTNSGQNAAGVWHYTCGSGCAGGSGTAGACGNCGSTLNHNQAYHQ